MPALLVLGIACPLVIIAVLAYGYFVPGSQVFGRVHSRRPGVDKLVALTFDDGPHPKYTEQVMRVLGEHAVKGTFFLRGERVAQHTDLVRRLADEGHELGNHTWSHLPWALSARYRRELAETQDAVERAAGVRPSVFRPPFGRKAPWLLSEVRRQGMLTVGWNVSGRDTKTADPQAIARNVISRARPGAIILLHDGVGGRPVVSDRSATITALALIIDALHADGYRFVTTSELLAPAHT